MKLALCLISAYLIGGIPFGFIIGKLRGVDVRTVGSKNIGATNVFRTVGKTWGLIAFLLDVAKGLIPVLLVRHSSLITHHSSLITHPSSLPLLVGLLSVIGHMLTPYMKFKGGKGVATAFGMLLGLVPGLVGVAFALFAIVFGCSHMISLGSCTAALFLAIAIWFPILGAAGVADIPQCVLVTLMALFVIWKHRANLRRIAAGTENKIYLSR